MDILSREPVGADFTKTRGEACYPRPPPPPPSHICLDPCLPVPDAGSSTCVSVSCRLPPDTLGGSAQVRRVLSEYKIHNCEVLVREDVTVDDIVDVVQGNRK